MGGTNTLYLATPVSDQDRPAPVLGGLVTVWQSKSQLEAIYAAHADTILTNHLTKLFFTGMSDTAGLDYVGRLTGHDRARLPRYREARRDRARDADAGRAPGTERDPPDAARRCAPRVRHTSPCPRPPGEVKPSGPSPRGSYNRHVAAEHCLRRCEVLGLRLTDLNAGERRVCVAEAKNGYSSTLS